MPLSIHNEFSPLKEVIVCPGMFVPEYETYHTDDPEHLKYHHHRWDKELLLRQQDMFFEYLVSKNVKVHLPKTSSGLQQQMFTRDIGWVIRDTFYFAKKRKRKDRNGEVEAILPIIESIPNSKTHELTAGFIEGGDVLIDDGTALIGLGSRSTPEAAAELGELEKVKTLLTGQYVMHLDTRCTLLPGGYALLYTKIFNKVDLEFLAKKFKLIPITDEEAESLGSNVFVIDPETIVVESGHTRIADELKARGFNVIQLDYSEPIHQGGSFRCTTLPLVRDLVD